MKNYLTIQEAAEMLCVSVQTVRNWGETGELKEVRTPGGHRRYDVKDVEECQKRWKTPRTMKIIYSWECLQDQAIMTALRNAAANDPRVSTWEEKGGFTKTDVGMLLKNQDFISNNVLEPADLMEILSSFSAPYFIKTQTLNGPNDLLYYKRIRIDKNQERRMVCESEEVCARTRKADFWSSDKELMKETFITMANEMDAEFIQDIIDNAHILSECASTGRYDAVANVMKMIDEKTLLEEPKFVIYPPELWDACPLSEGVKITPSLFFFKEQDAYVSRLVPHDTILVGVKSELDFWGYSFCPYMFGHDEERHQLLIRYGKKLLREGSNFFGVVRVK